MNHRRKLFRTKDLFAVSESADLFVASMRENCRYHAERNGQYKAILDSFGFRPEMIGTEDDLAHLVPIPTALFKKHELYTVPPRRMAVKVTSSGTGGSVSRIGFDFAYLRHALGMVMKVARFRKLFSLRPTNYIVFGYRPRRSNRAAVTKTAFGATLFAPALHRTYALEYKNGEYVPDLEGVISAILKYSRRPHPVRFMGFPSYTYFVMKMMDDRGLRVTLPKGSKIMLGGGWKQFWREEVDKSIFYDLARRVLGVEERDIVEFFGAVEHPVLYCDCEHHHFHVPIYSRVIIRDPATLEPVGYGKVGLVNLLTPMVRATPVLSVMTDDLGVLHEGSDCPCGIRSPYLEIIGRVGMKEIRTCAAGAADILEKAVNPK